MQTTTMIGLNSLFETTVDISGVGIGAISQVTMHRASNPDFSISLIYDKTKSDAFITENSLNAETDVMLFLQVQGGGGNITYSSSVKGVDKASIDITIDFTESWKAKVRVAGETFLNLG